MISIDKSLNGQKITTKNGDILKVQLAENPLTIKNILNLQKMSSKFLNNLLVPEE